MEQKEILKSELLFFKFKQEHVLICFLVSTEKQKVLKNLRISSHNHY